MDNQRNIRTQMLLGIDSTNILAKKHVAVFGIGGVGSYCAEALARSGVGALTLVDDDTVSVSNLNRQLVALRSTIGLPKVEVMAGRIADISDDIKVTTIFQRYLPENRDDFFHGHIDFIADCIDSVGSKTDLIASAFKRGIPIISAMGTGNKLDPCRLQITDLSKTSGCPLARVMRRELKKHDILHHTVIYSTELPTAPHFQPDAGKNVPGSAAWVPGCAGLTMAGHIIQKLLRAQA
ncbi:MAG: tRNA threonylcarbamoyladenosine dehydratase [Oscillospiraceae bacterium]|nr:tRNA threonylcarbamoyladenosine dehydratase [Oscillospiraceae bacterium]